MVLSVGFGTGPSGTTRLVDQRREVVDRIGHLVVHHQHRVEILRCGSLFVGSGDALLDPFGRITTVDEPLALHVTGRRFEVDAQSVGEFLLDRLGP